MIPKEKNGIIGFFQYHKSVSYLRHVPKETAISTGRHFDKIEFVELLPDMNLVLGGTTRNPKRENKRGISLGRYDQNGYAKWHHEIGVYSRDSLAYLKLLGDEKIYLRGYSYDLSDYKPFDAYFHIGGNFLGYLETERFANPVIDLRITAGLHLWRLENEGDGLSLNKYVPTGDIDEIFEDSLNTIFFASDGDLLPPRLFNLTDEILAERFSGLGIESDTGLVLPSDCEIYKTANGSEGAARWAQIFVGRLIVDKGHIPLIVSYGINGIKRWEKKLSGVKRGFDGYFHAIGQFNDGTIVAGGVVTDRTTLAKANIVVCLSEEGEILWQDIFNTEWAGYGYPLLKPIAIGDKILIVIGSKLRCYNKKGNLEWYTEPSRDESIYFNSVTASEKDWYLTVNPNRYGEPYDVNIWKVDSLGRLTGSKKFGTQKREISFSIEHISGPDSGIFVGGLIDVEKRFDNDGSKYLSGIWESDSPEDEVHGMIMKMTQSGKVEWVKGLSNGNETVVFEIIHTPYLGLMALVSAIKRNSDDTQAYAFYLYYLDKDGKFNGARELDNKISQIHNISLSSSEKIIILATYKNGSSVILRLDPSDINHFIDPLKASGANRASYYLDLVNDYLLQIETQNSFKKDQENYEEQRSTIQMNMGLYSFGNSKFKNKDGIKLYLDLMGEIGEDLSEKRREKLRTGYWSDSDKLEELADTWAASAAHEVMRGSTGNYFVLKSLSTWSSRLVSQSKLDEASTQLAVLDEYVDHYDSLFNHGILRSELRPLFFSSYYNAQYVFQLSSGNYGKAESAIRNVIFLYKDFDISSITDENIGEAANYFQALLLLANLYMATNRLEEAKSLLEEAIEIASQSYEYGRALSLRPQLELAGLYILHSNQLEDAKSIINSIGRDIYKNPKLHMTVLSLKFYLAYKQEKYWMMSNLLMQWKYLAGTYLGFETRQFMQNSIIYEVMMIQSARKHGYLANALVLGRKTKDDIRQNASGIVAQAMRLLVDAELAQVYHELGEYETALSLIEPVSDFSFKSLRDGGSSYGEAENLLAERTKEVYFIHLQILSKVINKSKGERKKRLIEKSLLIGQRVRQNATSSAISKMATRFGLKQDRLANLVKTRESIAGELGILNKKMVSVLLEESADDPERTGSLNDRIKELEKELALTDSFLLKQFPRYVELTNPTPINYREIQESLFPGELALITAIGPDESYIWYLQADTIVFNTVMVPYKTVDSLVIRVRDGINVENLSVKGIGKRISEQEPENDPALFWMTFDIKAAHELYRLFMLPASALTSKDSPLVFVLDGPLQRLPPGIMIMKRPNSKPKRFLDYRKQQWLALNHPISVIPSISSLVKLRSNEMVFTQARKPLIGFGNPRLGPTEGGFKNTSSTLSTKENQILADTEELNNLPGLPETEIELKAIALSLGVSEEMLYMGIEATETNLKELDLSPYRYLVFSTHGLLAGELKGLYEPALVFTPPSEATSLDDGALTISEIAQLELNSDLVILSACNTAGGDGTGGAESLSGLAKSFFYAGSRSILVSHWPVEVDATIDLTTKTLAYMAENPHQGAAKALQYARIQMINNNAKPHLAHPLFWAPFVVVGNSR